ncbi:MAG TPA: hypothetical protein VKQ73_02465 [Stellaceae bacterium]|nr:hypothetical protein [Stellaceae bacterium]
MKYLRRGTICGLAIALIVLSPIVLIFALPVAIGAGLDIFAAAGETPVAVALALPLALVLVGAGLARVPVRHAVAALAPARRHPGRAARQH